MKRWKKIGIMSALAMMLWFPSHGVVLADAVIGESVVTLGKDLTPNQREAILREMQVAKNVKRIEVTNQEEYQYLGNYMSKATIGTRAISSAKITLTEKGKGISIRTHNISAITEAMYANAAITAGIKDADIYVTAPFKVSGTAGLTGIIRAFETATGQKIGEEQKQVANEEMVRTSEIADVVKDPDKAAQFMNRVKEEVSKQKPATIDDYKNIVVQVSNEFNITLDSKTLEQLVSFLQHFSDLNIDWSALNDQFSKLRGNINDILNSKETQGVINTVMRWLGDLFTAIGNFFTSSAKG